MTDKALSRRAFIAGLGATAALGWLYDSDSITARLLRGTVDDAERSVVSIAPADLSHWTDKSVDVCWVGHATVLLNFFGVHILTDPVLFDHIGAQIGLATLGRKRIVAAALDPFDLPRIDAVLLSHAHMDHMDLPSLQAVSRKTPSVLTAPQTTDILSGLSFRNVNELRWGQSSLLTTPSGEVEIEAFQVKHWGARWKNDSYRGYVGFVLKRGGKTIVFGGDTAYTDSFSHLKQHHVDLAIMPIGCYGRGTGTHCTPEEAVRMANHAGADFIVPIHHSTFPLGKEPIDEPLERFETALSRDRIALRQVGQTWRLPA